METEVTIVLYFYSCIYKRKHSIVQQPHEFFLELQIKNNFFYILKYHTHIYTFTFFNTIFFKSHLIYK